MTPQEEERPALKAKLAKAREVLEELRRCADAYPVDVFPEPDLGEVTSILKAAECAHQMDRMHASWARHILDRVGRDVQACLQELDND